MDVTSIIQQEKEAEGVQNANSKNPRMVVPTKQDQGLGLPIIIHERLPLRTAGSDVEDNLPLL